MNPFIAIPAAFAFFVTLAILSNRTNLVAALALSCVAGMLAPAFVLGGLFAYASTEKHVSLVEKWGCKKPNLTELHSDFGYITVLKQPLTENETKHLITYGYLTPEMRNRINNCQSYIRRQVCPNATGKLRSQCVKEGHFYY